MNIDNILESTNIPKVEDQTSKPTEYNDIIGESKAKSVLYDHKFGFFQNCFRRMYINLRKMIY